MKFDHASNMNNTTISEKEGSWRMTMMIKDNHPFVHIDFVNMKPSVYKELKFAVEDLKYFLACMGYPYLFGVLKIQDYKMKKFTERLGFKEIAHTNEGGRVMVIETDIKEVNDNG